MNEAYKKQVKLLLEILPEVAQENVFALHGGTAINLFIRNMPRLSVYIDLTYIPKTSRIESVEKINLALAKIKNRIENRLPALRVQHRQESGKLNILSNGILVKLEVNLTRRGLLGEAYKLPLCKKTQEDYQAFTAIQIVPFGQLYGGKICAALARQHPRDLFDVKLLLDNEEITREVVVGFLLALVGHERPMHELLRPHLLNQELAMKNQFAGMAADLFTYSDFEEVRSQLIVKVNKSLTDSDRDFLISLKSLEPKWNIFDFKEFPEVLWKLRNLDKLKKSNPKKYQLHLDTLKETLEIN